MLGTMARADAGLIFKIQEHPKCRTTSNIDNNSGTPDGAGGSLVNPQLTLVERGRVMGQPLCRMRGQLGSMYLGIPESLLPRQRSAIPQ